MMLLICWMNIKSPGLEREAAEVCSSPYFPHKFLIPIGNDHISVIHRVDSVAPISVWYSFCCDFWISYSQIFKYIGWPPDRSLSTCESDDPYPPWWMYASLGLPTLRSLSDNWGIILLASFEYWHVEYLPSLLRISHYKANTDKFYTSADAGKQNPSHCVSQNRPPWYHIVITLNHICRWQT